MQQAAATESDFEFDSDSEPTRNSSSAEVTLSRSISFSASSTTFRHWSSLLHMAGQMLASDTTSRLCAFANSNAFFVASETGLRLRAVEPKYSAFACANCDSNKVSR